MSPDGKGKIQIKRGIEVGHIFQLGTKYSESMRAKILDENGKDKLMHMGCYGIGIGRIVAAAIEQNNDEKGIIWPDSLARSGSHCLLANTLARSLTDAFTHSPNRCLVLIC